MNTYEGTHQHTTGSTGEQFGQQTENLGKKAERAVNQMGDMYKRTEQEVVNKTREFGDNVSTYVKDHPLMAIGIAFAVGLLLSKK